MPCSFRTRQVCTAGEPNLVDGDVVTDQVGERPGFAAARNADAVLRIAIARRSSASSLLRRLSSPDSGDDSDDEGIYPASIHFRRGRRFTPRIEPTWMRAATWEHCSLARCSRYILTARLFGTPFGKRGSDDRVAVGRASDSGPSDRRTVTALLRRGVVACWVRRGR